MRSDTDNDPADTRLMGIVHDALRRDITRMEVALSTIPPPDHRRRLALADHAHWLMRFLHDHHTGEDEGLWPLVRQHDPSTGALLDRMDADHARIAPAITEVQAAADDYGRSDAARERLCGAVDDLREVLLPHLRREEDEAMPVVASTLTRREWTDWDERFNIANRSFAELGYNGHWLLDGQTPQGRDVVVHLVPPVPRFILLHGFARSYRRRSALLWGAMPDRSAVIR